MFKFIIILTALALSACATSLHNGQVLLPGNPSYGDLGMVPR